MRTLAGPDASLAFTNLSSATSASLSATFNSITSDSTPPAPAHAQVECHEQGVLALMKSCDIPLERVCLLDPKASLALTPSDGDAGSETRFPWARFGLRPVFFFPVRARSHPRLTLISLLGLVGLDGWIKGILGTYMRAKENLERRPDDIDDEQVTTLREIVPQSFAHSASRRAIWVPCR